MRGCYEDYNNEALVEDEFLCEPPPFFEDVAGMEDAENVENVALSEFVDDPRTFTDRLDEGFAMLNGEWT